MQKNLGDTDLTLYAGIFPRSRTTGDYSPAFFSDSLVFYDNNLEGVMLQLRRPHASFEVACDWMGQYGPDRREKFMVFSAGEGEILPFMSLGYAGYLYHFANSYTQKGVVDNILLNPYLNSISPMRSDCNVWTCDWDGFRACRTTGCMETDMSSRQVEKWTLTSGTGM